MRERLVVGCLSLGCTVHKPDAVVQNVDKVSASAHDLAANAVVGKTVKTVNIADAPFSACFVSWRKKVV